MGKRSRRKRPGRAGAHASDAGARTAGAATAAVAAPTLADQRRATVRSNRERGDPLAEANRMMQEFLSLLNEDPWNSQRLSAFDSFGEIMMLGNNDKFDYDSKQVYLKFLKKVVARKQSPSFTARWRTKSLDVSTLPFQGGAMSTGKHWIISTKQLRSTNRQTPLKRNSL